MVRDMSKLEIVSVKQAEWKPFLQDGCINVAYKSYLHRNGRVAIASLKFGKQATIHEHPADMDVDVICLEGAGFTSVGDEQAPIQAGQRVHWPAGQPHRLWTEATEMITLMVEHLMSNED